MNSKKVNVKFPKVFRPIFRHSRYKILYGGRGRGASWNASKFFILKAMESKIRVLCCREVQLSIKDSVHKLIESGIEYLGLTDEFNITDRAITCKRNGSDFVFIGLNNSNKVTKIKSYEDVDYVYFEEAENASKNSLNVLIPTIRKTKTRTFGIKADFDKFLLDNPELNYLEYINESKLQINTPSEIWILFNPDNEDDEVYERFVTKTPDSCIKICSSYKENPYFPATLRKEMEDCKREGERIGDMSEYNHIWLGYPKGAGHKIYAKKFDKKVNVRSETRAQLFELLKDNVGCFMGMDPHSKYYPFCIWLAVLLNEHNEPEYVIYNEFPSKDYLGDYYAKLRKEKKCDLGLLDLAQMFYSLDGIEYGLQIKSRFVDTRYSKGAGGDNIMTNSQGMIETWKRPENGNLILCAPQEKMIDIQRMNILTDLDWNREIPISTFNKPKLTIAPWCENVIDMLENHRESRDGKTEDEKRKDASDTLRILYAGISGMTFIKPVKKQKRVAIGGWMGR